MIQGLMSFPAWCRDEGNDEKLADRTVIDMITEIPLDYDCIECRKAIKYCVRYNEGSHYQNENELKGAELSCHGCIACV
jgi:MinD superfamily P-loop ATPase